MATTGKLWGLLAQYESPQEIYPACEQVRDAGYTAWDSCTPFPVHGLDKAMGIKPTKLPWFVLASGLTGFFFAIGFEIWAMTSAMPIIVGGKPMLSIPAFVPVWYEFTVLSSCLAVFFGNWAFNRLPQYHHPTFQSKAFARVTDDKFFIVIEAADPQFDLAATRALLQKTGAAHIEEIEDQP